jgi:hypothetical protein
MGLLSVEMSANGRRVCALTLRLLPSALEHDTLLRRCTRLPLKYPLQSIFSRADMVHPNPKPPHRFPLAVVIGAPGVHRRGGLARRRQSTT